MTAVVGILNKHAVAIAADSAVTIGGPNGKKIFNRANKVFTLSKYHPVGVMIYNSAFFMSTPWETIIKVYRKQLGGKNFNTLKEFQEDFIIFLRNKDFYLQPGDSENFIYELSHTLLSTLITEISKAHPLLFNSTADKRAEILQVIENLVDNYIAICIASPSCCADFADYTYDNFKEISPPIIARLINDFFLVNGYIVSLRLTEKISNLIYIYLKREEALTSFTGLIFTGFGDREIYPSLIPVNISLAIGPRLRYYIDETNGADISNENDGAVCPFAQTDVIETILSGIAPRLDEIYLNNFEEYFVKFNRSILNVIGETNPAITAQLNALNIKEIVREYKQTNFETKRNLYIRPLMEAVNGLSKEDIAEMAESLVYLTYLKRRMTNAEESVGGPVDVAIITKGDGFIWIKRKHYFNPALNQYFFDNYFK